MKLNIFGASGAGTTTLANILAQRLGWKHLDADDYYWEMTNPPFTTKIPLDQRNVLLWQDLHQAPDVIISGSLPTWGKQWDSIFDLAVFLWLPPDVRLRRIKDREYERYGDIIYTDEAQQQKTQDFFDWAAQYDDENFDGRSITQHRQWIARVSFPVLKIEGDFSIEERAQQVLDKINQLNQ